MRTILKCGGLSTASVLYTPFEGANSGTVFYDWSQGHKSITRSGSPVTSTTQCKIGTTSGYFPGSAYLSLADHTDFKPAAADKMLVSFWFWANAVTSAQVLLCKVNPTAYESWMLRIGSAPTYNKLYLFKCTSAGNAWDINAAVGSHTISQQTWYHVWLQKNGTSWQVNLNGASDITATATSNPYYTTDPLYIGAEVGGANTITGYIDDLIIWRECTADLTKVPTRGWA